MVVVVMVVFFITAEKHRCLGLSDLAEVANQVRPSKRRAGWRYHWGLTLLFCMFNRIQYSEKTFTYES